LTEDRDASFVSFLVIEMIVDFGLMKLFLMREFVICLFSLRFPSLFGGRRIECFFLIGNLTFDRRFLEHDDLTFSEKQKKVCVVSMRIKQQSVLKRLEKFELKLFESLLIELETF
jgi:hypothetical protein